MTAPEKTERTFRFGNMVFRPGSKRVVDLDKLSRDAQDQVDPLTRGRQFCDPGLIDLPKGEDDEDQRLLREAQNPDPDTSGIAYTPAEVEILAYMAKGNNELQMIEEMTKRQGGKKPVRINSIKERKSNISAKVARLIPDRDPYAIAISDLVKNHTIDIAPLDPIRLQSLQPKDWELVGLTMRGFPVRQIARIMDTPSSSLESNLMRIRQTMNAKNKYEMVAKAAVSKSA